MPQVLRLCPCVCILNSCGTCQGYLAKLQGCLLPHMTSSPEVGGVGGSNMSVGIRIPSQVLAPSRQVLPLNVGTCTVQCPSHVQDTWRKKGSCLQPFQGEEAVPSLPAGVLQPQCQVLTTPGQTAVNRGWDSPSTQQATFWSRAGSASRAHSPGTCWKGLLGRGWAGPRQLVYLLTWGEVLQVELWRGLELRAVNWTLRCSFWVRVGEGTRFAQVGESGGLLTEQGMGSKHLWNQTNVHPYWITGGSRALPLLPGLQGSWNVRWWGWRVLDPGVWPAPPAFPDPGPEQGSRVAVPTPSRSSREVVTEKLPYTPRSAMCHQLYQTQKSLRCG